ncbi:hypothetical protein [Butyricicoccus pullicaecorum]|uniref:Uncharacterized protein n=1 Tax=Butyricicoccus pullicaecorum 1.2 TaxID=1203606 RepID=R8VSY6_9FIRM|nr:hypothetical protein [Butyricicoccus pullicaecorum]EOQ35589.1 hypothetical protein HMPREF1526_03056 [Butyricicoccus pullicaecorum 1.2]SKA67440.1 hypothetical protein SAMN02745978_02989 [Butyricicoccus pullicaecorum DSM 23266]
MPNHFCPQCGTPLAKDTVSWRVSFPPEIIDAPDAPFLLDFLNARMGSAEVRSAGELLLTPEEWHALQSDLRAAGDPDQTISIPDSSTYQFTARLRDHTPVSLQVSACCPHCGQPHGGLPGQDLPADFFQFERVIGVAIAGAVSWGKTCLLLSLLLDQCAALNRASALNPCLPHSKQTRFYFTAPRLSDRVQEMLRQLNYSPYRCPQGTRALDAPIPLEMDDRTTGKRYLILLYDTAGEFYNNNQAAQLRFLRYAAGLIYLISPEQTLLRFSASHACTLQPLSEEEQARMQADPSRRIPPTVWRRQARTPPVVPAGNLLRDLRGLNGSQNLLPCARDQHVAYVLVKADRLYGDASNAFSQLCGADALKPEHFSIQPGAYYMRSEVNALLFDHFIGALPHAFQPYFPHYSLHTVSALGSEPVVDPQSNLYHLTQPPAPHLVEEPLLSVIRHGLTETRG